MKVAILKSWMNSKPAETTCCKPTASVMSSLSEGSPKPWPQRVNKGWTTHLAFYEDSSDGTSTPQSS